MAASADERDFPVELQDKVANFDESLTQIENVLSPLLSQSLADIYQKLTLLDQAKIDLIEGYAVNSLFWMYLNVKGENPKEHPIKQELERIRNYMTRLKDIQDKEKAPTLDKNASKRFVRSALWKAAHKQADENNTESTASTSSSDRIEKEPPTKRIRTEPQQHHKQQKHKKKRKS